MNMSLKTGIVIGATVLGAGLGYKLLGGSKRERTLGTLAGGMLGFGVSRFTTGMIQSS